MKTITVEIEDDEVLVAIKRPEEYDDVHPQLLVEDVVCDINWCEWRVLEPAENT